MIDVIVFSSDEKVRNDLSQAFAANDFWVKQVENNKQLTNLDMANFDLIIANIEDKEQWVDFLKNELHQIPLVVLSQSPVSYFYAEKYPKNLIEIVSLPVPGTELFTRFKNIIRGLDYYQAKHAIPGSIGKLTDFSFLEIIQNFMRRKYTGILKIDLKKVKAEIYFHEGGIDRAVCEPDYKGLKALEIITFFDTGDFEFVLEDITPQQEIKYDMQKILFNLIEKYSQFESLLPYLPKMDEILVKSTEGSIQGLPANMNEFLDKFEENITLSDLIIDPKYVDKQDLLMIIKELYMNKNIVPFEHSQTLKKEKSKKSGGLFKGLFGKREDEDIYEEIFEEDEAEELSEKKLQLKVNLDDIRKIREQIKN